MAREAGVYSPAVVRPGCECGRRTVGLFQCRI